jgi:hypothetical protein
MGTCVRYAPLVEEKVIPSPPARRQAVPAVGRPPRLQLPVQRNVQTSNNKKALIVALLPRSAPARLLPISLGGRQAL